MDRKNLRGTHRSPGLATLDCQVFLRLVFRERAAADLWEMSWVLPGGSGTPEPVLQQVFVLFSRENLCRRGRGRGLQRVLGTNF